MKLQVDGREVYAYTGGKPFDATLPTLVLLHGAICDHTVWNLLARWFAHHGHGVLAFDLPGHMRSEGPALPSIESMAEWLLKALDAAGVQRVSLAGHSMGSLVALEAAARMSQRQPPCLVPERLVMLGSCVPMPVPQALLDLGRRDVQAAIERVVTYSFCTLAAKPSFPGPGVWLRGGGRRLMQMVVARHPGAGLFDVDFSACNAYRNGSTASESVTCTSTFILGRFDQMTLPRHAKDVADALMARTTLVDAGHSLMQEAPDAVLDAMRHALA